MNDTPDSGDELRDSQDESQDDSQDDSHSHSHAHSDDAEGALHPHLDAIPMEITQDPDDHQDVDKPDPTWRIIGAISMATVVAAGAIVVFLMATGSDPDAPQVMTPREGTLTSETSASPSSTARPTRTQTTETSTASTSTEPTSSETQETSETSTTTETPTPTAPEIPSARRVTEWAKVTTGLSPSEPFSAASPDTWMHSVTGVLVEGTGLVVDMNADASIDIPAGTAAAEYYSAVLSGASNDSWESLITEVTVLDNSGTPMVAVAVQR